MQKNNKNGMRVILEMDQKSPVAKGPTSGELKQLLSRPCIGTRLEITIDNSNEDILDEVTAVTLSGIHACEGGLWLLEDNSGAMYAYSPGIYIARARRVSNF